MSLFVDTSALLAILDADNQDHPRAQEAWKRLLDAGEELVCTNYVLLETFALVQRRLGQPAVRALQEDITPLLRTEWVDPITHNAAVQALLTAGQRALSLVDCASFVVMRRLGIEEALTLDRGFGRQGFRCQP